MCREEYSRYADLTFEIGESLKDFRENLGRAVTEECGLLGEVDDIVEALQKLTDEFADKEEMA